MYISLQQAQSDFADLLATLYDVDWRLGQQAEQIGYPILTGEFTVLTPDGTLGDIMPPDPIPPVTTNIPGLPQGPLENPYTSDTPSFLDIINQIGAAVSGGAHAYASSYTDILKAQMQIAAMKAQAQAGFVASPTIIPNSSGFGSIPPWVLLAGLGLVAVVAMGRG